MEFLTVEIGILAFVIVLAYWKLDQRISDSNTEILESLLHLLSEIDKRTRSQSLEVMAETILQGRKTRKDLQETKTRLTQARKDLNVIEKLSRKEIDIVNKIKQNGNGKHGKHGKHENKTVHKGPGRPKKLNFKRFER